MRAFRITFCALAILALESRGATAAPGDPTINEVRIDQTGTDNDEYFELAGTPAASLNGLTYIVIGDGSAAQGSGVVETVVSLAGKSIATDGLFLVTEGTFTFAPIATVDFVAPGSNPLNFENDDNTTHMLVRGFTGSLNQDLDTNDDGTLDVTPWTEIVDSVALFKSAAAPNEKVYSATVVGPDGTFVPGHAYRLPDGTGGWRIGAFNGGENSPGTSNALTVATDLTIPQIQGAGHTSPFAGTKVRTTGIVTARTANGFFVQDPVGDGNDATSDGIFVFTSSAPTASVGDALTVEGIAQEFTAGAVSAGNLSTTEIIPSVITTTSTGNTIADPVILGPSGRVPPTTVIDDDGLATFDPASDGIDFYESVEGMRVRVLAPVAISRTNDFGEIWVLADGGAGATGVNARGGITLTPTDFNPERMQIQVGDEGILPGFDPQLNVGDRLGDVTGVLNYDFGQFQILATATFAVTPGPIAREASDLFPTGDRMTIAGFNTHNLDPNDLDGDTDVADGQFERLASQIVVGLRSPDVVALQEIQDNNGSLDNGVVESDETLDRLALAIFEAGGPAYEYAYLAPSNNQDGGEPGGNIRVAYLYNSVRVSLVAGSLRRIVDTNLGDGDAFASSRKPLVAGFLFDGHLVTVIDVHFTSKGGSTPLFGRVQPPIDGGAAQRLAQTTIVRVEVDTMLASDPLARIVVAGDCNDFDFSVPITTLEGGGATGLSNLTETHPLLERHSYVFEGNSQSLDHVLVSRSLESIAEHDIVHVNSEFADQASDHDPQVVRLRLVEPPTAIAGADRLIEATGPTTPVSLDGTASTGPAGHALTFTWTEGATTIGTGPGPTVSFAVGAHTATLTVEDAVSGLSATDTVTITIRDTTAPTVTVPADITVDATSPSGAVVTYSASASDAVGVVTFNCIPASGSTFSAGTTTVDCTATDAAGNHTTKSFHVTVRSAAQMLDTLLSQVIGVGPGKSLESKVRGTIQKLTAGNTTSACSALDDFINEVKAQAGKKITQSLADALIAAAKNIQAALGR